MPTKARNGIFSSVIVVDGKIAGTWKRTLSKDSVAIEKALFRKERLRWQKSKRVMASFWDCPWSERTSFLREGSCKENQSGR